MKNKQGRKIFRPYIPIDKGFMLRYFDYAQQPLRSATEPLVTLFPRQLVNSSTIS